MLPMYPHNQFPDKSSQLNAAGAKPAPSKEKWSSRPTFAMALALINWTIFAGFVLTTFTLGRIPGEMHPVIFPFFLSWLVSPITGVLGVALGLAEGLSPRKSWTPFWLSVGFLIIAGITLGWVLYVGQSV